MGKGGKHKKRLRSEKAKTKLKQKTKFLPKGLNVTKVDFKIKPIVLSEQLRQKSTSEGPLSRRKLNVQELLSRLKHHNAKVRCDSLGELRAIVVEHGEVTQENLAALLKTSCTLLLDSDRDVRNSTTKLLGAVLNSVGSPQKIEPFFDVLLLHLQCCMTNIDVRIQDTSLIFLDVLLKNTPTLVAARAKQLLQNFIGLISVTRNNSHLLSVNVDNKLTSVQWRTKVLGRLQAILEAVSDARQEKTAKPDCPTFEASRTNHVGVYNNFYENSQDFTSECDGDGLSTFVPVLIQLLYETWLEVTPEKKHHDQNEQVTLNEDGIAILNCVTNILHLLMVTVPKVDTYRTGECNKLLNGLFGGFPYTRTKNFGRGDPSKDPKCTRENLLVCSIFCTINTDLKHQHLIKQANAVVDYTNRCLSNRNYVDQQNLGQLAQVVKSILIDNAEGWSKKHLGIEKFLENVLHYYKRCGNAAILKVLCDVYSKPYVNGIFEYQKWLGELPGVLTRRDISEEILTALIDINRRRNLLFRRGVVENLPQILENLPTLDRSKQSKIIPLLYGVENLDQLHSFVRKNQELSGLLTGVVKTWCQLNCGSDYKRLCQKYPWLV